MDKTISAVAFTVKYMCGCRLVFGQVPLSEFEMLAYGMGENAMIDMDIANRIGATFVIGSPDNLGELRKMELPVSEKRQSDYASACNLKLDKVASWLRDGERGASSNAMCKRIFGVPSDAEIDHPLDPSDLRRCLLFLKATDAQGEVSLMKGVSTEWDGLVEKWSELVEIFDEETRASKKAPRTYALMKTVLQDAEGAPRGFRATRPS